MKGLEDSTFAQCRSFRHRTSCTENACSTHALVLCPRIHEALHTPQELCSWLLCLPTSAWLHRIASNFSRVLRRKELATCLPEWSSPPMACHINFTCDAPQGTLPCKHAALRRTQEIFFLSLTESWKEALQRLCELGWSVEVEEATGKVLKVLCPSHTKTLSSAPSVA